MKNLKNWKTILMITTILILGGVAVATALRLYQKSDEAVAPTAPELAPAAENEPGQASSCQVSFSVATPTPTATSTPIPTMTPTPIPTATPTPTVTPTPTSSPTPTATTTPIPTLTPTPTSSPTPTATSTPIPTMTPTPMPTATPIVTSTPTPAPASSCNNLAAFDQRWQSVSPTNIGQTIYLAVKGNSNHPKGITRARFQVKINGQLQTNWCQGAGLTINANWCETTNERSEWLFAPYIIQQTGNYQIEANVYAAGQWY